MVFSKLIIVVALKRACWDELSGKSRLSPLAADPPGQLDVLGHDGDPLGVDGTEVGVLKQSHKVGLAGFLQGHHGGALEAEVSLEVLSNLPHKALERQLHKTRVRHCQTSVK